MERYSDMAFIANVLNGMASVDQNLMLCELPGKILILTMMHLKIVLAVLPTHDESSRTKEFVTDPSLAIKFLPFYKKGLFWIAAVRIFIF